MYLFFVMAFRCCFTLVLLAALFKVAELAAVQSRYESRDVPLPALLASCYKSEKENSPPLEDPEERLHVTVHMQRKGFV